MKDQVSKICKKVIKVINPAETITNELWEAITKALEDKASVRIEVTGEEDLAFIPCMLLAPDNAVVIYGYPDRGMVIARVTPENRNAVSKALKLMIKEV